jgi:hypothetical protein
MKIKLLLCCILAFSFGCSTVPKIEGEGIKRSWKTPFFTDVVSSDSYKKITLEDGTVVREAVNYNHDTTVLGWGREVSATKAVFEVKEKK